MREAEILRHLEELGGEQESLGRSLTHVAKAIQLGQYIDPNSLRQAIAWLDRLSRLSEQLGGTAGALTVEGLEVRVRELVRNADPRRKILEALIGATSEQPVVGLERLTELARSALDALEGESLDQAQYAPLEAIHELLAADGEVPPDRLNACVPLVVQAQLPVTLVLQDPGAIHLGHGPPRIGKSADRRPDDGRGPKGASAAEVGPKMPARAPVAAPVGNKSSIGSSRPGSDFASGALVSKSSLEPTSQELTPPQASVESVGESAEPVSLMRKPRQPAFGNGAIDATDSTLAGPADAGAELEPSATASWDALLGDLLTAGEPLLAEWLLRREDQRLSLAVRALRMSWQLGEQRSDTHDDLEPALQHLLMEDIPSVAEALLAAAAALMSAPIAPRGLSATVARQAGRSLETIAPTLARACARLAIAAENGELTAVRALQTGADHQTHAELVAHIVEEARDLLARLLRERSNYVPASRVLHTLVKGRGPLGRVLNAVMEENVPELEGLLDYLDDREIRREIDEVFRRVDKKNRPLEAHARQWILDRCARVLALGRKRIEIERRADTSAMRDGDAVPLRGDFQELDAAVVAELNELSSGAGAISGAAAALQATWKLLRSEILEHDQVPRPFRTERQLRQRFACIEMPLDDNGLPVGPDGLTLDLLSPSDVAHALELDLWEAAQKALGRSDFVATDLISEGLDDKRAEELFARVNAQISEERRLMLNWRRSLELRLTRLIRSGALEPREEAGIATLLELCDLDGGRAMAAYSVRLTVIESKLSAAATARAAVVSQRLAAARPESEDAARVHELIAEEQFDVADELVQQMERGERLPPPTDRAPWLERFLSAIESLDDHRGLIQAFERREQVGELNFASVSQALRSEVLQALQQLKTLKTPASLQRSALMTRLKLVLLQLGFDVDERTVRVTRTLAKATVVELTATPGGAEFLPPEFGSAVGHVQETGAGSRLAVILARGTVNDREVLDLVRRHGGSQRGTLILLPDDPATLDRRRQIARLAREERATFLLIDEYTLINQALARSENPGASPLDITIATCLPFCWLNPYVHTGAVPPEMFVGRTHELQELQDRTGSCFIFGGRQLGKSAMLRTIRRREHHPASGRLCIMLDLMAHGIGERKPGDQLWGVIAAQLDEVDVGATGPTDRDSVVARIRQWLMGDQARQLRLLLDECDLFLEGEAQPVGQGGQNFANVLAFRSLMDETDRRFKVVIAGLHSVNRFRRIPNFPLAHFGSPAPVGPLDWADARKLVELPLRTAGFRFDPPDLVDRVLVETRRHPSLVQFACDALIQRFFERSRRRGHPPFVLHAADLDDLFDRSKDLRDRIRERFEWTLNLDKRYRVLALMIAMTSLDDVDARTSGMTAADLHEQALAWWPAGFGSLDRDGFEVLLEEMVNLEVLGTSEGRYRLPATNLLRLLGDREEVISRLEQEVDDEEPPLPVTPDELRRDLAGREAVERSPITFRDERTLLREDGPTVRLVFGTDATHVQRVDRALSSPSLASEWPDVRVVVHPADALPKLAKRISNSHPKDDVRQVHVIRAAPGTASAEIARHVERFRGSAERKGGRRHLLILVLDAARPERWAELRDLLDAEAEDSRWVPLRRWTRAQVGVLFNDLNIPAPGPQSLERIMRVTGGWPAAVETLVGRLRSEQVGLEDLLDRSGEEIKALPEPFLTSMQLPLAAAIIGAVRDWQAPLDAISLVELLPDGVGRLDVDPVVEALVLQQVIDEVPGGYVVAGPD